jgi:two-component system, chemotaxis family, sensor kinase CheA
MSQDPALATYINECRELLEEMEMLLLSLEQRDDKTESLNAIFRAAHTIKGSAGLFGLNDIVDFTHVVETVLDQLRDGTIEVTSDLIGVLLGCSDHIGLLVEQIGEPENSVTISAADSEQLLSQLRSYSPADDSQILPIAETPQTSSVERIEQSSEDQAQTQNWHISLRFDADTLRNGMEPSGFFRYLANLGTIISIKCITEGLPELQELDAEQCYLGFEISFRSDASKQEIEDVFEFAREDSEINILPPHSRISEYIGLLETLPEEDLKIGEMLVQCGSLTESELEKALSLQQQLKNFSVARPLGDIMVEKGLSAQPVVEAAIEKQAQVREVKQRETQSLRIDAERLDHLINLIGELVIASASTSLEAQASQLAGVTESVNTLSALVEDIRDAALHLRMVQIGATFSRFNRVVRDASVTLDKQINLQIKGAETEVDKAVAERISDPLMHLVRNAMDHGIEPPQQRVRAGKPAQGLITLNAFHDSGSIVIEITDDGAGLDKDRILEKALAKGLVEEGQHLEEQQIYQLIFEPGFSTADAVTDLSGRGVGMDVVKRNISALRGSVELTSEPGQGTTCHIRLPLTLAIIDGFLVDVAGADFIVPLELVVECVELPRRASEKDFINLRGEVLPLIRLRRLFQLQGAGSGRQNVVVVSQGGRKAGLLVDQLKGELQTVIKPLGQIFSHIQGLGGSTILGNGKVALILNIDGLMQEVTENTTAALQHN